MNKFIKTIVRCKLNLENLTIATLLLIKCKRESSNKRLFFSDWTINRINVVNFNLIFLPQKPILMNELRSKQNLALIL